MSLRLQNSAINKYLIVSHSWRGNKGKDKKRTKRISKYIKTRLTRSIKYTTSQTTLLFQV